jgi:Family of unknown function (DUF5681)
VTANAIVRGRPFQPGQSGNPGGRPRSLGTLRALARTHAAEVIAELARLAMHARSETARVAAIRELLDRAFGKATQFLATDDDVIPEDMSAAELRAEIVAQFEQAFPEYRVLKVVPSLNQRPAKRRQTLTNGPPAALIGSAAAPKRMRASGSDRR